MPTSRLLVCFLAFAMAGSGCATRGAAFVPLVDMQGKDAAIFDQDLRGCQQYAEQAATAAQGAVVGAIVFGLLGAALAPRGYRNNVASRTAAVGAGAGAGEAVNSQENVIRRCLAGRGYNVLN